MIKISHWEDHKTSGKNSNVCRCFMKPESRIVRKQPTDIAAFTLFPFFHFGRHTFPSPPTVLRMCSRCFQVQCRHEKLNSAFARPASQFGDDTYFSDGTTVLDHALCIWIDTWFWILHFCEYYDDYVTPVRSVIIRNWVKRDIPFGWD